MTCDAPLQLAVIVGSTREGRLGSTVAEWLVTRARQRDELALDVIDLVDVDLPMIYPEVPEPTVQVGDRTAHCPDSRGRLPRGSRPMTTRRALCVVVVGRSPEKMKPATAVLRSVGFATIAAFSEEQAHLAIAARDELFAIVTGGAIDQPARDRLRAAAAQKGAVLVTAHIADDDPEAHFPNNVLPKLRDVLASRAASRRCSP